MTDFGISPKSSVQKSTQNPDDLNQVEMKLFASQSFSATSIPKKLTVSNLKLCPLCDSLNAKSNSCCFVCGWRGSFIHDPKRLQTSLVLLIEQCPEIHPSGEFYHAHTSFWGRLFQRFFRRRLDFQA